MKKSQKNGKAKKAQKKAEKKAVRISLAQSTNTKASRSESGLASEIKNHYNLEQGASYKRGRTNDGIRRTEHDSRAQTLDTAKACQTLKVDEYDTNKKRRQETIEYIKSELGAIKAGTVIRWKGRNNDTKAGNLNTCAKYFFSNVKSSAKMDCQAWNFFTLTSTSEKAEGK